MTIKILHFVFLICVPLPVFSIVNGGIDSVEIRKIEKEMFQDNYISVSLMVVSPGSAVYSAAGHASIRMQCKSKAIDYCYDFDTDVGVNEMLDYINGDMKASIYRHHTQSFINYYKKQHRGINAIELNLLPEQEITLWSLLDNEADAGVKQSFDFMNYNCSSVVRMFIEKCLGTDYIKYKDIPEELSKSYRATIPYVFEDSPWAQLFWNIMMGTRFDDEPEFRTLLFPGALLGEWSKATIISENGKDRKMIVSQYRLTEEGKNKSIISPTHIFWGLVVLSLLSTIFDFSIGRTIFSIITDFVLMTIETVIGIFLTYLLLFSHQMATSWNWLIIVFSPIPCIACLFMHKEALRRIVFLLFTIILIGYIIFKPFIPQMNYAHLYLLLIAFAIRTLSHFFRNSVSLFINFKTKEL